MDKKNEISYKLPGIKKAAIVAVALGEEMAGKIYKYLSKDEIAAISEEVARTKSLDRSIAASVLKEFYNLILANQYVNDGGFEYAKELIFKTLPENEAKNIISRIEKLLKYGDSFAFLSKIDSSELVKFFKSEHPQTVAVVLANMKPKQAADILSKLDERFQNKVMLRMASTENVSPEVLRQVSEILKERLKNIPISKGVEVGGVKNVAEIFNNMERENSKKILETLSKMDEKLASKIRDLMFVFDDIVKLDNKSIQEILKRIDKKNLIVALKGTTEEIKEKFLSNMSHRAADTIKEEMDYLGAVKVKEVSDAQHNIVEEIRTMDDESIISLSAGEEDQYVS